MAEEAKVKARLVVAGTEAAKRQMSNATQSIVKDAGKMAAGFVGIAGTVALIEKSFRESVSAYLDHEKAIKRVEIAGYKNVSAVNAWANALQDATGRDSDAILGLAALAKSFNATEEQAKKMTQTALDMEAMGLMSADGAVRQLGKSLGGLAGELLEVAPELRGVSMESLKAGAAIDALNKRVNGAAEAVGNVSPWDAIQGKLKDIRIEAIGIAEAVYLPGDESGGSGKSAVGALEKFRSKLEDVKTAIEALDPINRFKFFLTGDNNPTHGPQNDPQQTTAWQVRFGRMAPRSSLPAANDPVPVVITNASGGVMGDINAELGLYGRVGPGAFLPGARTGASVPGYGPGVDMYGNAPGMDWAENTSQDLMMVRDLSEQAMSTLTNGLLDSIFYARDLADVFKSLFRQVAGSAVQFGITSILKSAFPGAAAASSGGGYDIGTTDNNPQLQSMSREISRQQVKARRRGF